MKAPTSCAVLDRAAERPEDERVAQALHLVVRTTQVGCRGQGEISRAAFRQLHRRYPASVWAEQTPYRDD